MLAALRLLFRALELVLALPLRLAAAAAARGDGQAQPRAVPACRVGGGGVSAVRAAAGLCGSAPAGDRRAIFLADKLRYDAERWLATAVYDAERRLRRHLRPQAR